MVAVVDADDVVVVPVQERVSTGAATDVRAEHVGAGSADREPRRRPLGGGKGKRLRVVSVRLDVAVVDCVESTGKII